MRKKLRSKKGTTLVELLAVVAVVALLAMMIGSGLGLALNSYRKMVSQSETQMLLSTVSDVLTDELRYARDVRTTEDGELLDFTSVTYGRHTTLSLKNGHLLANGSQQMLSTGVYGKDSCLISVLNISYDADEGMFNVTLKVANTSSFETETHISVRCMNEGQ
jgi:prepilin-type N-terminal cleavage/methylation domain-containing protein